MKFILLSIAAAVLLTFIFTLLFGKKEEKFVEEEPESMPDAGCCGAHEVCERDRLLLKNVDIVYYQDEELDVFRTKAPHSYSSNEIEIFREVLYTMHDNEVAGWLRSLHLRQISPPDIVREEALMIIADVRNSSLQIENINK